jgi:hypothetical protein
MNLFAQIVTTFLLIAGNFFVAAREGAAQENPIGKVIAVEGSVSANERTLARGASIFVSDVIQVAEASKVQIKFTDGGVVNLIPSTQYRVDSYEFSSSKNEYSAELLEGGFRAASGAIGKKNPEGTKVKTPVATIGIRGTIYAANIVDGETAFGCDSGEVVVSNDGGERELHEGAFVTAFSADSLGDITTERPDALDTELFAAPEGGESLESAEAAVQAGEYDEGESTDDSDESEEDEESSDDEEEVEELDISESEGNPSC